MLLYKNLFELEYFRIKIDYELCYKYFIIKLNDSIIK